MLNIVLFGPPGAGKGTQAEKLKEEYKLNHISTGEVIRGEIASGSGLGRQMEGYISRGELAPDDLVIKMVADFVEQHSDCNGNIFDGFPRTTEQAKEFDRILAGHGISVDMMIALDVPDEEVVTRLMLRGQVSGRADDLDRSVILNRLEVYKMRTAVVSDYYEGQGKFISVDGTGTPDEIFERLKKVIDQRKK